MDNQEPSSSSYGQQQEVDKVEDKQVEKNLKEELKSDGENQVEVEDKSFIDELPPEMLMQIFKCLNVTSLVNCRLVSRKWNGLARQIIQSSDNVETVFYCRKTKDGNSTIEGKTKGYGASLNNFIKYFEYSKESPLYTRFRFDDIDFPAFNHVDWLKFISYFGQSVKSLRLVTRHLGHQDNELVSLVGKLRNLLLNQLPNLQVFGLQFPYEFSTPMFFKLAPLFPITTTTLANLKVLYLDQVSFFQYTGIVTDLLRSAVNLQTIEPYDKKYVYSNIETFQLLRSLGKLDCVKTAHIRPYADFISKIQGQSSAPLAFKLKKLDLDVDLVYANKSIWSDASLFLSNLFESSKDSLRELTAGALGFLQHLHLSKFKNLDNLVIDSHGHEGRLLEGVFPSKFNLLEMFPVLRRLELQAPWTFFSFHSENGPCLPNLKSLKITGREMRKEDIAQISKVFPNLKKFSIDHEFGQPIEDFPEVGTAIWTHLKSLQSLELAIDTDFLDFPALDPTFTGFSKEYCEHLYDSIEIKKCLEEDKVSEAELEKERQNPSILDLKYLEYLKILLVGSPREEEEEQEEEYESEETLEPEMIKGLTFISEEYAFKLMKSLTYEIDSENED